MRMIGMSFIGLALIVSTQLSAAGDPLARVSTIHLQYQANAELNQCKTSLANALAAKGLRIVSHAAQADAILQVKIDVQAGKLRSSIRWGAILEDLKGSRLFSAYGEESSWTAEAACKDLADDLAAELKDDIRNARILSF